MISKLQKKKNDPNSSYWNKRAMKEWSRIVRYPWCERCGKRDCKLDAHHIQDKAYRGTRFMLENGICLCPKCHKFGIASAHKGALIFTEWFKTAHPKRHAWVLNNYNREETRDYKTIYEELVKM